jgi:streptogramin lyase
MSLAESGQRATVGRCAVAVLAGLLMLLLSAVAARASFTQYNNLSIDNPIGITVGPDEALWFTNAGGYNEGRGSIGRITTEGMVTNYTDPSISEPLFITAGPDGALWFTNRGNGSIGRITTDGVVTNYKAPCIDWPEGIVAGPDGALWFTNFASGYTGPGSPYTGGHSIGRITTEGVVTCYSDPSISYPSGIIVGSDGALWFTNFGSDSCSSPTYGCAGTTIGRITTEGVVTSYGDEANVHAPAFIATGSDGALWFTNTAGPGVSIGRLTTEGVSSSYSDSIMAGPEVNEQARRPNDIATEPNGNLVFTEAEVGIGQITTTGEITRFEIEANIDRPRFITVGPDGGLWFTSEEGVGGASRFSGLGGAANFSSFAGSGTGIHWVGRLAPAGPTVTNVTPSKGPVTGGTSVTITGTKFTGTSAVKFGSTKATSFKVDSDTSIEATAPPGTGTVSVVVSAPGVTGAIGARDKYSYVPGPPPPTITKLSPKKGSPEGGTTVTITGANLLEVLSVSFGGVAVPYTISSPTSIAATAPPGVAGALNDVRVTTPSGTSAVTKGDRYTYLGPSVIGLSPAGGPRAGGTTVTVTGTGFAPGKGTTAFAFRKTPGTSVECESTTKCTVIAPAGAKIGPTDVIAAVGRTKAKKNPGTDLYTYE